MPSTVLQQAAAHVAAHFRPDVYVSNDPERDAAAVPVEDITSCLDRIHQLAEAHTGEPLIPQLVDFLDDEGDEVFTHMSGLSPERLRAALAYTAAKAAALQRELFRAAEDGAALVQLIARVDAAQTRDRTEENSDA